MNADFEQMWRDLAPVGRSALSGGYFRQPWTAAELELRAWFREQAAARDLVVEEDPFGNLVAWWHPSPPEVSRLAGARTSTTGVPRTSTTSTTGSAPGPQVEVRGAPATSLETKAASTTGAAPVPQVEVRGAPATSLETKAAPEVSRLAGARTSTTGGAPLVEEVAQRPSRDQGAVLTGSHLDSVLDGGAYDGPLGVVSALAAVDLMRERGVVPARPLGIAAFVEEEGSRFGRACLGSRLAVGAASWAEARELTDPAGTRLGDLVEGGDPTGWLAGVSAYVELHVEQGRGLVGHDAPVGVASGIWPHGRWRFDLAGRADHAGTTRMEDRADPMLTYAATALAAAAEARGSGQRATFGRVEVHPNGTNAVPSAVTAWLDARADSEDALAELVRRVEEQASDRAGADGTTVTVTPESVSGAVGFDEALRDAVGDGVPVLPTQAGHDAGILQAAGVPSAMLFVRNPTGVSHSPAETAGTDDCLAGVTALADALGRLLA